MAHPKKNVLVVIATGVVLVVASLVTGCCLQPKIPPLSTADATPTPPPKPQRFWERFPLPPSEKSCGSKIGEDADGRIWVMGSKQSHYWDAEQRQWIARPLTAVVYMEKLFGGPATGLYATQRTDKGDTGNVYLLEKGEANLVTQFTQESGSHDPGFCVLARDRFLNWSFGKIRIYADGKWHEHPATLAQNRAVALEGKNHVAVCDKGHAYVVSRNGTTEVREYALPDRAEFHESRSAVLGDETALFIKDQKIIGFEIATGRTVDTSKINQAFGNSKPEWLYPAKGGHVWVRGYDSELPGPVYFHIQPNGHTRMLAEATGMMEPYRPRTVGGKSDGNLWGMNEGGVFHLHGADMQTFDYRFDGSPASASEIFCDSRDIIYITGPDGHLYAYNHGSSLIGAEQPAYPKTFLAGKAAWTSDLSKSRISKAWLAGDLIILRPTNSFHSILGINVSDGTQRFAIPDNVVKNLNWACAATTPGKLYLAGEWHIVTIDANTGDVLSSAQTKYDPTIPPVPVEGGFVITPEYRGKGKLTRLKEDGSVVWACDLKSMIHKQPTELHGLLIVQLSIGRSSENETIAMDTLSGELIWHQTTPMATGMGVQFMQDPRSLIETKIDSWAKPPATRISSRVSISGEVLWDHDLTGGITIYNSLYDPVRKRIFCTQATGAVHCIDAGTGSGLWSSTLQIPPLNPYNWSDSTELNGLNGMMLLGENLGIIGTDWMLHVLDAASGNVLGRVQLMDLIILNNKRAQLGKLTAGPWVVGEHLIVATTQELIAYPLDALNPAKLMEYNTKSVAK